MPDNREGRSPKCLPEPEGAQPFVDRLVQDLAAVPWLEPAQLRARARRRTLRSAVGGSMVLVLVLVGVWGSTVADRGTGTVGVPAGAPPVRAVETSSPVVVPGRAETPAPPPPAGLLSAPTQSPPVVSTARPDGVASPDDPAWIPPAALLRPTDLGSGYHLQQDQSSPDGSFPAWTSDFAAGCPGYASIGLVGLPQHRYLRSAQHVRETGAGQTRRVRQDVARYPVAVADEVLTAAGRVVRACGSFDGGPAEGVVSLRPTVTIQNWTVRDDDFAGDRSLLVRQQVVAVDQDTRERVGVPLVVLYVVVRVGDLVTVVQSGEHSEARARQLAAVAAVRLCAVTGGC